jgi:hypothetical protein
MDYFEPVLFFECFHTQKKEPAQNKILPPPKAARYAE